MTNLQRDNAELIALLPCPFCGPRDELSGEWPQLFEHSSDCVTEWSVRCGCCAIELGDEDREQVIAAWNTRSLSPQPPAETGDDDAELAASRIITENIENWGWGPLDEIDGLAEHQLALKAAEAGYRAGIASRLSSAGDDELVARLLETASPRPWRIVPYGDGDSLVIHDARSDWRVCFMATPGSDHAASIATIKANAELIVAAVNRLEALSRKGRE